MAMAQQSPKLSPLTRRYIREAKERIDASGAGSFSVGGVNGGPYLSGLIKVGTGIDQDRLLALGVRIGTKAGAIWTVRVPMASAEAFTQVPGILYIQLDEPTIPMLDSARRTTRVDSVHAGYGLPMPYDGTNVVMGVVDAGFDYTHPTLFDTAGTGYRVKRLWEQKNSIGPSPAGYSYGTEMTDPSAMWAKGTDDGETHGTHVAGICAGSGYGSVNNSRYRGMAYGADLVFVGITPDKSQWVNTGVSDMIDGIAYVFKYAESVGKPAVVNLSWGSPLGPHDGTGLFSQALDNLIGPGKIFVCAAGNNGGDKIHIRKAFTPVDSMVRTFLTIDSTPIGKRSWVDIWGDPSKSFCVDVTLYHGGAIASSGFICLDDSVHALRLVGSNGDTCFVDITTSASEFNGRPRVFLDFYSRVADSVCISLKGSEGMVDMWDSFVYNTSGYYGSFTNMGQSWAVNGNSDLSISDLASTRSAITVGAYASKISWKSLADSSYSYSNYVARGRLVPFSSHGPTSDGRVKPDIAGPGLTVASAISSYDTTFNLTGSEAMFLTTKYLAFTNREYHYGVLSGTSMASPAVSGIVALMLQIRPTLTPQEIKDILTMTAIKDGYTGTIPAGGNNTWGNGKVNAYGAVRRVLEISAGVEKNAATAAANCSVYPNLTTGAITLTYMGHEPEELNVEICNLLGQIVHSDVWMVDQGYNSRGYDLKPSGSGIYFIRISSREGITPLRVVVR